jgi:hypothetical protein
MVTFSSIKFITKYHVYINRDYIWNKN